jgi:hypothetical protein
MAAISNKSTASVEAISSYINANFKTDNDKIRAALDCLNISYDVANNTIDFDQTEQNCKDITDKKRSL